MPGIRVRAHSVGLPRGSSSLSGSAFFGGGEVSARSSLAIARVYRGGRSFRGAPAASSVELTGDVASRALRTLAATVSPTTCSISSLTTLDPHRSCR